MKRFLIFAWAMLSIFAIHAAPIGNPAFLDFNTNQFSTVGRKISLLNGVVITNAVYNGITYKYPETNCADAQFFVVAFTGTNELTFFCTNILAANIVVNTIEELVDTPVPPAGVNYLGYVLDLNRGGPFIYRPTLAEATNEFKVYPSSTGPGQWARPPTDDIRLEWGAVSGFAPTNATLVRALTIQSTNGVGRVVLNGSTQFLHTDDVPMLDNNVLYFEDGAQATGLTLTATGKTNISIVGGNFSAAAANPAIAAVALTNCNHVFVQIASLRGYSSAPMLASGNSDTHFLDLLHRENTPQGFGAIVDGLNDDTLAVQSLYNTRTANGITMNFPAVQGKYKFNLLVTNDNVTLSGELGNDTTGPAFSCEPADMTRPIIQVGNDSGYVYGFKLRNMSFNATVSGVNAPGCLLLFGGPLESSVSGCSFYNGADTVKFQGGTNFPVTLIDFQSCNFWEGTNSTLYLLRPAFLNGYVTGIYLNGCHVNGHNTSGYAVRLEGARLSSVNSYFDLSDNHALWIKNAGSFRGFNVELEAGPTGAGLVTVSDESVHDPARFLSGTISMLGTIVYQDATFDTIPNGELFTWTQQGYIQSPYIRGPIHITTSFAPFSTSNVIESLAIGGPLRVDSGTSALEISPSISLFRRGESSAYGILTENTPSGGVFLGAVGTNENVRLQPVGGGNIQLQGPTYVSEDFDPLKTIYVWGNNAFRSGIISVVGAGGGLFLGALGTNQNIQLLPSGTGIVDVKGAAIFSETSDFLKDIYVWGSTVQRAGWISAVGGAGGLYLAAQGINQNVRIDPSGTGILDVRGSITLTGVINFPDGIRQIFNPDGTVSGLNVGAQAGDPSTPVNGDLWYDSTANELTARINGANVALGAGGGSSDNWSASGTTNSTLPGIGSADGFIATNTFAIGNNQLRGGGNVLLLTNAATATPEFRIVSPTNSVTTKLYSDDTGNASTLSSSSTLFLIGNGAAVSVYPSVFGPSSSNVVDVATVNNPFKDAYFSGIASAANLVSTGATNYMAGSLWLAGNSAASTPAERLTGTWFTGGSATTTKPHMLIEPSGTTSTGWSTSGTGLGINAASGFAGNLFDAQVAGVTKAAIINNGDLYLNAQGRLRASSGRWEARNAAGTTYVPLDQAGGYAMYDAASDTSLLALDAGVTAARITFNRGDNGTIQVSSTGSYRFGSTTGNQRTEAADTIIARGGVATVELGTDAATATAQTIKAHDGLGTDKAGADMTIAGGQGTGTGTAGRVKVKSSIVSTTGSSANAYTTAVAVGGTLKVDTTTTGNVGAGEDNLITYSVPAGQLAINGDHLEFDAFGTFAANANTKRVKAVFGATTLIDSTALIFNGIAWRIHGKVIRTGAATQVATAELTIGGVLLSATATTIASTSSPAETLSGAITFKCTAEDSGGIPADNAVVQNGLVLKWGANN